MVRGSFSEHKPLCIFSQIFAEKSRGNIANIFFIISKDLLEQTSVCTGATSQTSEAIMHQMQ